jgi:hypothetical protein
MPSDPLLPDPSDVEHMIARRSCLEPSADLRDRILTVVSAQRRCPAPASLRNRWKPVWQAAAAIVLAVNLWMTVANTLRVRRLAPIAAVEEQPVVQAARPGISDTGDASDPLQLLTARILANLTPAPQTGALSRHFFSNEEEREWALP